MGMSGTDAAHLVVASPGHSATRRGVSSQAG